MATSSAMTFGLSLCVWWCVHVCVWRACVQVCVSFVRECERVCLRSNKQLFPTKYRKPPGKMFELLTVKP